MEKLDNQAFIGYDTDIYRPYFDCQRLLLFARYTLECKQRRRIAMGFLSLYLVLDLTSEHGLQAG